MWSSLNDHNRRLRDPKKYFTAYMFKKNVKNKKKQTKAN